MNIDFPVSQLVELNEKYKNNYSFSIVGVSSFKAPKSNRLIFAKKLSGDGLECMHEVKESIIIIPTEYGKIAQEYQMRNFIILSENPRLEYAVILNFILNYEQEKAGRTQCLAVSTGKDFSVGNGSYIGHNVVIGDNVEIGENCVVMPGTVINNNVRIGDRTIIRENAVIGGYGFGFERDDQGIPIRIPHLGGVVIGNHVEIGALTTIVAGTIEPTIIDDYAKIDDHVHIAHNCHIGKGCLITACAEVSGSVKIGEFSWLGPNCSIINGITIGKNCFIGIGAVVKKSVADALVVSGDPARSLEAIVEEKDLMKQLLTAYLSGELIVTK